MHYNTSNKLINSFTECIDTTLSTKSPLEQTHLLFFTYSLFIFIYTVQLSGSITGWPKKK